MRRDETKPRVSLLFVLVCASIGVAIGAAISWPIFGNPIDNGVVDYLLGAIFGVLIGWDTWGRKA